MHAKQKCLNLLHQDLRGLHFNSVGQEAAQSSLFCGWYYRWHFVFLEVRECGVPLINHLSKVMQYGEQRLFLKTLHHHYVVNAAETS